MNGIFGSELLGFSFLLLGGGFYGVQSQTAGGGEQIGCLVDNGTNLCFEFFKDNQTWVAAWAACHAAGQELAQLRTTDTDGIVGTYLETMTQNIDDDFLVWIGGHELGDTNWSWIDRNAFQSQNTSATLMLLNPPSVKYDNCIAVSSRQPPYLSFISSQCKNSNSFICEQVQAPDANVTSGSCQIGSNQGRIFDGSCFAVVTTEPKRTWWEARQECHQMDADLAIFNETLSSDTSAILSLLPNSSAQLFWIGSRRQPWAWVLDYDADQKKVITWEELIYSGWDAGIPYQRYKSCLSIFGRTGTSHGWTNAKCDDAHPYICQKRTIITTTPATTLSPESFNGTWENHGNLTAISSDEQSRALEIIIPCVVVAAVVVIIGVATYCYFSKRRAGYTPQE